MSRPQPSTRATKCADDLLQAMETFIERKAGLRFEDPANRPTAVEAMAKRIDQYFPGYDRVLHQQEEEE